MDIVDQLNSSAFDVNTLDNFIENNFEAIYDYFTWNTDILLHKKLDEIKEFITLKRRVLLALPKTKRNLSFLALLLQIAERLRITSAFQYLYDYLKQNGYSVGLRLEAAAIFLTQVKTVSEYIGCFTNVYEKLSQAVEEEEDNHNGALTTIVNYYTKGILDNAQFNITVCESIEEKIQYVLTKDEFSFLQCPLIWDILKTSVTAENYEESAFHMQTLLDTQLDRGAAKGVRKYGTLLEEDTEYCEMIARCAPQFTAIRQISVREYQICGDNSVYRSLGRGTGILANECQLFGYMNSYGRMHFAKLDEAYQQLPLDLFLHHPNIIDWGCGQGMATMVLMEYLEVNHINLDSSQCVLIEPSAMALQRAALHIRKFEDNLEVITINTDMDSLQPNDFKDLKGITHLHLFSNVLDMDLFSLTNLIKLIKVRFHGNNYFVIVSPYVDDTKTERIDTFVNSFTKLSGYKVLASPINQTAGEWESTWTRVQRMFYVEIN